MDLGHTIRSVVVGMPFILRGRPKERAGVKRLASRKLGALAAAPLQIDSPAFANGARIPVRYTAADGANVSPPLRWSGVPTETRSLVLLVEDPDAPTLNPFVHWIAVLPPRTAKLREGAAGAALEGRSSTLKVGWIGCAPSRGDVPHHY